MIQHRILEDGPPAAHVAGFLPHKNDKATFGNTWRVVLAENEGESLVDTLNTLAAMRPNAIVMRHAASGAPHFLARHLPTPIINAGDGTHEHPTQGLLDLLTLRDQFGRIEGVKVCIVGDVLHSRVARSNIWGLTKMGAEVAVCGPRSLLPNAIDELGVKVFDRIDAAIEWADALNVLRLQLERMTAGYIPSLREYNRVFGVSRERLERAPRELVILHPGPMNRGVEIDSDVADGPFSVILDQVTNGLAVRMAVLYLLSGGRHVAKVLVLYPLTSIWANYVPQKRDAVGSVIEGDFNWLTDTLIYQLEHSTWEGLRFYDLIWPSFMLMVGVSIPFSYAKRSQTQTHRQMTIHALISGAAESWYQ